MDELQAILQIVGQGGLSIIIFVIWYFTFKQGLKETKAAFDIHRGLSENLLQLLKDEQEYKIMLAGILTRLEEKLTRPVACPIKRGDDHVN